MERDPERVPVDRHALRQRIEAAKARAAETRAHLAAATDQRARQWYEHELRVHEHAVEVEQLILAGEDPEGMSVDVDEVRRRIEAAQERADEARERMAAATDPRWRERFEHELRVHERAVATGERVLDRLSSQR